MENLHKLTAELDALFNPKSVAIVGLPRGKKMGKLFLVALLDSGFGGKIYPVHPDADEIDGLKAYSGVSEIPGPVDLAIILVPHTSALEVVKDCAAKRVKGAVLFTAGYKETGTDEGNALQDELTRIARSSGMRILGPNCMGLYCPKSGLSFFPELSSEPGPMGLVAHSGSLANILVRYASKKGIRFSKVASLGNECDVNSADLIAYLGNDQETRAYRGLPGRDQRRSLFFRGPGNSLKTKTGDTLESWTYSGGQSRGHVAYWSVDWHQDHMECGGKANRSHLCGRF